MSSHDEKQEALEHGFVENLVAPASTLLYGLSSIDMLSRYRRQLQRSQDTRAMRGQSGRVLPP